MPLLPFMDDSPLAWLQPLILAAVLLLTILLMLRQAGEMKRLEEAASRRREFITILDCGGREVRRPFREGEYVGARAEGCDGEAGVVKAIVVKPEEEKRDRGKGIRGLLRL
ncbi:hypothetical protein [Aeropyrum camini]|uniref:Uncharacterized protein n=1 Tax=Aeropyrum camini SY1 = JCM 12091 TaxID=1198449 RepID=U3TE07_9CREN|nr:hypothetical protein [Aeropyrum camini]BAN90188.1 hypothetical protein ACAM_0719 [Aeropyrum camini SY1 = JCM 12091]